MKALAEEWSVPQHRNREAPFPLRPPRKPHKSRAESMLQVVVRVLRGHVRVRAESPEAGAQGPARGGCWLLEATVEALAAQAALHLAYGCRTLWKGRLALGEREPHDCLPIGAKKAAPGT